MLRQQTGEVMATIERRTFLIGSASMLASPAIALMERFTGPISTGILNPALKYRKVADLIYATMPTGKEIRSPDFLEDPVRFTFYRDDEAVLAIMTNPRATTRWVALPGEEIEIQENQTFRMVIEPCHTHVSLTCVSNIERDWMKRPQMFPQVFRWEDGKPVLDSTAAMSFQDASVLR